mgnify:CR=1 FL=1
MKCKVCKSKNINKVDIFKPYIDKKFEFKVYDCFDCKSRFIGNEDIENYKDSLYSECNTPYKRHYTQAEHIKDLLNNDLQKCKEEIAINNIIFNDILIAIENSNKNISILEVGCATGYITAYLQKIGYKNSYGIDLSDEPIKYAKKTFGDYFGLHAKSQKYDVIFFQGVVGCVINPFEFLEFYLSLLSKNGIIIFNAPDVDSIKETNELWVDSPPPDVITLFHKDVFVSLLSDKYEVSMYKTYIPVNILKKYVNIILNRKNNIYPRRFIQLSLSGEDHSAYIFKTLIKRIAVYFVEFLVNVKLFKRYSNEYGLILSIKNKK